MRKKVYNIPSSWKTVVEMDELEMKLYFVSAAKKDVNGNDEFMNHCFGNFKQTSFWNHIQSMGVGQKMTGRR